MEEHRQTNRQPVTIRRSCVMGVITFKQLEWTDHVVHVVDISSRGVGIESGSRLEPGFVWFCDRVGGYKGGVMVWSRKEGDLYRAGIRFLSLTDEDEQFLQQSSPCPGRHRAGRSTESIVSALMESMTRNVH